MIALMFTKQQTMNNIKNWLASERGMAARLARELGINRSNITNMANGRIGIPTLWIPVISRMSKRKFSDHYLLALRNQRAEAIKNNKVCSKH